MTKQPTSAERTKRKNAVCPRRNELRVRIPSCLPAIEPVCEQIRGLLEQCHLQQMWFPVEVSARECLNNAITHGNCGDGSRWVGLVLRIGRKLICLQITDQGAGFDWRKVRRRGLPERTQASGRGLIVLNTFARRIVFNRQGNQVTVWISTARQER